VTQSHINKNMAVIFDDQDREVCLARGKGFQGVSFFLLAH